MKNILLLSTMLLASCGPNGNEASIEAIKADKEVIIEKEKTKQHQLMLQIEKEKNK